MLDFGIGIGQKTGRNLSINGVACTSKNFSLYYRTYTPPLDNYKDDPVVINSGTTNTVSWTGTPHIVICTDANGNLPSDTSAGSLYTGGLYINFTDMDTGIVYTIDGYLITKYET